MAGAVVAEAAPEEAELPTEGLAAPTAPQLPTGSAIASSWSEGGPTSEAPGSGYLTFMLSGTVQPFPILATNMAGRGACCRLDTGVLAGAYLFLVAAVIWTLAQFMYISRLPILLFHVHAKV